MSFTDFNSAEEVQIEYQIRHIEQDFLKMNPVQPPQQFIEDYKFRNDNFDIFGSDASRCENVIYPVLFEVCRKLVTGYSLWSHRAITVDTKLTGTP
ncbi:MAG: hypothetical protein AAF639_02130, partial [Chloroflexota bacterium]